jgi:protein involved in polysaccharide export with SLBB domain
MHMFRFALLMICLAAGTSVASAQRVDWNPGRLEVSRADLEALLAQLEQVMASPAYSDAFRRQATKDADLIRGRLQEGDFRPGDRIVLEVEGEPQLPDTIPVEPGPQIVLPVLGSISLRGVLRSELEDHLTQELGRFIQRPRVTARSMLRLAILGAVGQPGFYVVPADMLVGEALMLAGGPSADARMEKLRIERLEDILWEGERLEDAINEGATLDQMNLRAGDEIFLPQRAASNWLGSTLRYVVVVGTFLVLGVRVF